MNKLLLDTNIILDLLAERKPFYQSAAELFSLADKHKLELSVSTLSFANANYILSKIKSAQETREILRRFRVLIKVLQLNDKIIDLALNDTDFKDLEDGLHYYTAIENEQDFIITRDLQGFKKSKIPVMNAEEYLVSWPK